MNKKLPLILLLVLTNVPLVSTAFGQLLIAHRGASKDAPENTLSAFRLAWEQGADGVEGDFYLTKDQQIVCIHDSDTERTAGRKLKVAESTFDQLRHLDVGIWKGEAFRGERIPTLSEVLSVIPAGKKLYLEVKCGPEIVPAVAKELKNFKFAADQLVFISFNEKVIADARKQLPAYEAYWLCGFSKKKEESRWKPHWDHVLEVLKETSASGLNAQARLEVLTPDHLAALSAAGFSLHCYTVNDASHAKAMQKLGVESITTDRPAFLRECLFTAEKP
jgi:glycerophosphoryl diester phosphodiesterase